MQIATIERWTVLRGRFTVAALRECFVSRDDVNGIRIHGYDMHGRRWTVSIDTDTAKQIAHYVGA